MNPFSMAGIAAQNLIASLAGLATASNKAAYVQKQTSEMTIKASKQVANSFTQLADQGFRAGSAAKVMGGAFDVMMSALGTAFAPIIFDITEAFLNLTDEIVNNLIPAIKEWYSNLNKGARETGRGVGENVGIAAGGLAGAKIGTAVGSAFGPIGTALGGLAGSLIGMLAGKWAGGEIGEKMGNLATGQGYRTGDHTTNETRGRRNQHRKDMETELAMMIGRQGQVGFSGIADVWKQVQIKSFMSPFEKKLLDLSLQQLKELQDANRRNSGGFGDTNVKRVGGTDMNQIGEAIGRVAGIILGNK